MTRHITTNQILALTSQPDLIERLLALLERMRIDEVTGDLEIRNGAASLILQSSGTVRVTGHRIVQDAERDIALIAAWIDLN